MKTLVLFIIPIIFVFSILSGCSVAADMPVTAYPSPAFTLDPNLATAEALEAQATAAANEYEALLQSRGVACNPSEKLEWPREIMEQSTADWTLYTCSPEAEDDAERWTPGVVDYSKRYARVVKTDLSQTWTIRQADHDWPWMERPDALLYPYHWSQDGKYVYLYPMVYPAPGGFDPSSLFTTLGVLYRLNLATGDFEAYLPRTGTGYSFAFSPDDAYFIYADHSEKNLVHLLELQTETETVYELGSEYEIAGIFAWKADSSEVVFAAGLSNWEAGQAGISMLKIVPENSEVQTLLYNDERQFVPVLGIAPQDSWLAEDGLEVRPLVYFWEDYRERWALDIQTSELVLLDDSAP